VIENHQLLRARLVMKNWIMQTADPVPFELTFLLAITLVIRSPHFIVIRAPAE
jgi:hypothetical protein